jgi:hypothetical protein
MDPSMRLFEYNDQSLLASIPTMLAFPKVNAFYFPIWPSTYFLQHIQLHDCYQVRHVSFTCFSL